MSRYEILHDDKGLAFGLDHACGEFLMIWNRPPIGTKERQIQNEAGPDPDEMLVDVDTKFDEDFDRTKMLSLIAEHGFTLEELEEATLERFSGDIL